MNRAALFSLVALILITAMAGATEAANPIAEAIEDMESGRVRISYASRPGVWGNGNNIITGDRDHDESWYRDCEEGPVRVEFRVRKGEVLRIRAFVGGSWRKPVVETVDLGEVTPVDATDFLLGLAEDRKSSAGEDAVFPATLADGFDDWRRVIALARDRRLDADVRESAIFWLGQAAGEAATEGLAAIIDDDDSEMEVRRHAVFSLSQVDSDESVPALIKIARTNRHPQLRETAFFWLAQHEDPRVLDLFEEILTAN